MVMSKETNERTPISMAVYMNGDEKILHLTSPIFVSANSKKKESIVQKVVKRMREKLSLDDCETLVVKLNPDGSDPSKDAKRNTRYKVVRKKQSSNIGSYYCDECGYRFRFWHSYQSHVESHRKGNVPATQNIGVEGSNAEEGVPSVQRNETFQCEQCDKSFSSKHAFSNHQYRHRSEMTCQVCGKRLSRNGLTYHMKHFHGGVKDKKCDICGRAFAMRNAMLEHRRIHTGEKPFVCATCGKPFRTSAALFIHNKSHNNERPHRCHICNVGFKFNQQLKKHITIHTGERNYICDTCGKNFRSGVDLNRHKLTHSGLKPFFCPLCSMKFNQKRYLRNHLKLKHHLKLGNLIENEGILMQPAASDES